MDINAHQGGSTSGLPVDRWRKASSCGSDGGNCVEVNSAAAGIVGVRDTKRSPGGRPLVFPTTRWRGFLLAALDGRFDR
jgi:hypothetical protein